MNELELIKESYQGIHDHMIPMMLKTEGPRLRNRTIESVNPIIWQVWHILRTEDMFFNSVMFRQEQIFSRHNWKEKLNIGTSNVGTGMTTAEADELSQHVDVDGLLGYSQEVKSAIFELLDHPPVALSNPMDSPKEIERRLRDSDSFPEGFLQNRAEAYSTRNVSTGVIGLISHAYMHIGQYFAVTKPL